MLRIAENPSPWTGPRGITPTCLGAVPTLVDAGVGMPAHLDAVARALGGSRLARVLITHSHPDHVGGVPALLERWPGRTSVISRPTPAGTARSSPRATRSSSQCTHPGTRPITSASSTKRPATCIAATSPGGAGPSSSPPARAATSRNTSHRCAGSELAPARLLPGHGPIIEDVAELIDEHLAHRAEREQQVLEARDRDARPWIRSSIASIQVSTRPSSVPRRQRACAPD